MTARGLRLSNPLNIRLSKDAWQGAADVQSDKEFVEFKTPIWGIRAGARVLLNYQAKHGLRDIASIVARWAPPADDNDTAAYIAAVCQRTGFGPDQQLDLHKHAHLCPLVKAMIWQEQGSQPFTDAQIDKALVLAGVEPEHESLQESGTIRGGQIAAASTAASAGASQVIEQAQTIADAVTTYLPMAEKVAPWIASMIKAAPLLFAAVALIAVGYMVYRRIDDRRRGLR